MITRLVIFTVSNSACHTFKSEISSWALYAANDENYFNIYTNVLRIYTHFTEALYFIFLTELSHPSRCTTVTGSVRNVTSWFRTFVCTVIVRVISINVKKDTSLTVNISFDLADIYMYLVKKWQFSKSV